MAISITVRQTQSLKDLWRICISKRCVQYIPIETPKWTNSTMLARIEAIYEISPTSIGAIISPSQNKNACGLFQRRSETPLSLGRLENDSDSWTRSFRFTISSSNPASNVYPLGDRLLIPPCWVIDSNGRVNRAFPVTRGPVYEPVPINHLMENIIMWNKPKNQLAVIRKSEKGNFGKSHL